MAVKLIHITRSLSGSINFLKSLLWNYAQRAVIETIKSVKIQWKELFLNNANTVEK